MIPRRRLFALAAGLVQACILWPWRSGLGATAESDVLRSCLALFADRESATAVGLRYLALVPEERDQARLTVLVAQAVLGTRKPMSRWNESRLFSKAAVSAAIRAGFAGERVVRVDGWLLARLEARICALIALSERDVGA